MKKSNIFLLSLLILLALASCKQADVVAPTVDSFAIDNQKVDVEVAAGTTIEFAGTYSDDVNLGEYKISIHDDLDGHSHNKVQAVTPWSFLSIREISGTTVSDTVSGTIPSDATGGPYHCQLQVLDEAGNQSDLAVLTFYIVNADGPSILIVDPNIASTIFVARNDTLHLQGLISDATDLEEITFHLGEELGPYIVFEADIDLPGTSDLSWNFSELANLGQEIIIPGTTEPGSYQLEVRAVDSDGNQVHKVAKVQITP